MRADRRHPATLLLLPVLLVLGLFAGCGDDSDDSDGNGSASAASEDTTASLAVDEITVAAASDLRPAFEELGTAFTADTGTTVTFTFGSSGQLREQVLNGAPFDLFASATVEFVDEVVEAGRGQAETQADYAFGRIVVWAPDGVELPATVADLADPAYERIAIANPEHAPYGLAAQGALEAAGIYDQVSDRLVLGENISDTFQIVQSGNADAAIVALSLAIADGSEYTLVPEDQHDPLQQALVVTGTGDRAEAATAFADFISSPPGREIMVSYGFVLPGEDIPET